MSTEGAQVDTIILTINNVCENYHLATIYGQSSCKGPCWDMAMY